jgi:lysophospholipase L1-like esterase
MFNIPAWSRVHNPYHYQSCDSTKLVITVGDSWTYGDSLGKTQVRNGIDDTEYRLAHVYGNLISKKLQADWINLALPGISNRQMFIWLEQLLSRHIYNSNTICIITLTESGRHDELDWLDPKVPTLQANLESMVDKTYTWISEMQKRHPAIKFVVAHNFSDSRITNRVSVTDCNWLEILINKQIQNGTHVVVSEHVKQLNYNHTYIDTPDIIDRAIARVNILDSCDYCYTQDSRHPNEEGHKLWANYLLRCI